MVDLHAHILPGMDDGPRTVEESLALARLMLAQGVGTVAATPHFIPGWETAAAFCQRRGRALSTLRAGLEEAGLAIAVVAGAEVRLSPRLLEDGEGLAGLCYEGTGTMLVELPPGYFPEWAPGTLYELGLLGVTPLLAHVERSLLNDPETLYGLVRSGAAAQVNADAAVSKNRKLRRAVFSLIRHGLAQVVASDAHSPDSRPPRLREAYAMIAKKCGGQAAAYLDENSGLILGDREPEYFEPIFIKNRSKNFNW
jgi:protein-tyrosine phosphatase